MEALNTAPRQPILSIQEPVALMAKRPGITTGGGIERNTPNPDPKAAETYRKKVSVPGERYVRPRVWTPAEKAKLMAWRKQYGETTGTGVSGKMNPQRLGA